MPYIEPESRPELRVVLNSVASTPGELNFQITGVIDAYLVANCGPKLRYRDINEVIGALECAKLELYRRIAAPYEDRKIQENGDVYSSKS